MDLHPPGGPVRSLKDFFIHIGVVTLGILIALGLEQLVESHHRAHLADVAVAGFRRELAFNEDQVRDVLARIPEKQAKVDEAIAMLSTAPAAGGAPEPITYPGISLDLVSTASWDTAIATQALTELPFDAVARYAQAYGAVRLFIDHRARRLDDLGGHASLRQGPDGAHQGAARARHRRIPALRQCSHCDRVCGQGCA